MKFIKAIKEEMFLVTMSAFTLLFTVGMGYVVYDMARTVYN